MQNVSLVKQTLAVKLRNSDEKQKKVFTNSSFGAAADAISLQQPTPAKKQEGISKLNVLLSGILTGLAAYGIDLWRTPKNETLSLVDALKADSGKLTSFREELSEKIQKLNPEQYVNIQIKNAKQFKFSDIDPEKFKVYGEELVKQMESGALDDVFKDLIMLEENAASLSKEEIARKISEAKTQQIKAIKEGSTPEALKELAKIFSPQEDEEFIKIIGSKEYRDMMLQNIKENFEQVIKQDIGLLKHKPVEYLVELNQMVSAELGEKIAEVSSKAPKNRIKGWKAALIGFAVGSIGYVGAKMTVLKPKTENINSK